MKSVEQEFAERERIREYARQEAAKAPPLSPEQISRIATILGSVSPIPPEEREFDCVEGVYDP